MKAPALVAHLSHARLGIEIWLARRGVWLALAVAALAALGLLHLAAVMPARAQLERLEAELAQRERSAPASAVAVAPPETAALRDLLPPAAQASNDLQTLFELARKRQLRVAHADYQSGREPHRQFESLQVTLPLAGHYPAIRRWIEDVLRTMPHASIDQIAFEREAIGSATLVARVKLTLWLRPPGASAGDALASVQQTAGSR